jgi:hypothetical protein
VESPSDIPASYHERQKNKIICSLIFWFANSTNVRYYEGVNKKHCRTLEAIFKIPTQSNLEWRDCENLLVHLGAKIIEGEGSRVRIVLNGIKAVFHRPHPRKEIDKGALVSLRKFLENAGAKPEEKKP